MSTSNISTPATAMPTMATEEIFIRFSATSTTPKSEMRINTNVSVTKVFTIEQKSIYEHKKALSNFKK